jgi:hypothetical protein
MLRRGSSRSFRTSVPSTRCPALSSGERILSSPSLSTTADRLISFMSATPGRIIPGLVTLPQGGSQREADP